MASYTQTSLTTSRHNGIAIAGFACSVIGLLILGIVLGPLGIVFSGIGLSRTNHGGANRGFAIAGLVIGIIDVALFIVLVAVAASHGGHTYWHI